MAGKVYKDSVGIPIYVETETTITGATTTDLYIKTPTQRLTWSGAVSGTTQILYTTSSGNLNEATKYYVQPKVILSGKTYFGATDSFQIYDHFE